jgi:hypothetical protein
MKLAIIGTAGRKDDAKKLSANSMKIMKKAVITFLKEHAPKDQKVQLVSGGAAWADHVAVQLFLNYPNRTKLKLHLPCKFRAELHPGYLDTKEFNFRTNPGGTCNYYHQKCGNQVYASKYATLKEIEKAINAGADVEITHGLHARNSKVAQEADWLIAFTFGNGAQLKPGGTQDTVNKFKALEKTKAFHFDLNSNTMHPA